jgi:predicted nucleic acid-binding protein
VRRLAGGAVLDASVGVKWVVAETGHEQARAVLQRALRDELPMAMPDFMAVEVANALWAKVRRRQLTAALARESLTLFLRATARFVQVPGRLLATRALSIGIEYAVTVYDGCYLALARHLGLPLLTADAKLLTPPVRQAFDVLLLAELRAWDT